MVELISIVNGEDFLKLINWIFHDPILKDPYKNNIIWIILPSMFLNNSFLFWINVITTTFINENEKNINELILDMAFINLNNWYQKIFYSYKWLILWHCFVFFSKIRKLISTHHIIKSFMIFNFHFIFIFYINIRLY